MNILGIMSGTSVDGLDLAVCSFEEQNGNWSYKIRYSETIPYNESWKRKLGAAPLLSGPELQILDIEYGEFIAEQALSAIGSGGVKTELIASHGHTVFHQPEASLSFQLGNLQCLASQTGIQVVGDFRQKDVLLGGQGAPLVPVGDELLFSSYDYCLNLGGFANISYREAGKRLARDLCPANIILNRAARELDLSYDNEGKAGRSGSINNSLLEELNRMDYYSQPGPGSLSREWLESEFLPRLHGYRLTVTDLLRTLYEHISTQVARQIKPRSRILVTGGGAYNSFLVEKITEYSQSDVIVPAPELVEFKEAMIFALLGLLRSREQINCYASVTGAEKDSCCGVLYLP